MKTITVRGLDEPLAEKLKETAKSEGKSVNQFVIDSIRARLGEGDQKKFSIVYNDMDKLFGRWSQKEFEVIQGKIDRERKIDEDLWK